MLVNIGVYASMVLVTNAIILPPNLTPDSLEGDRAIETLATNPLKRSVVLECPGCPVASMEGGSLTWRQDGGNAFRLDFEVGHREDTLEIDGVQLYPPHFGRNPDSFPVTQVGSHKDSDDALRLGITGYTYRYNSAETITEEGTELFPITFRIASIESQTLNPPTLTINLLKDSSGRLMIASFETAAAKHNSPIEQTKECKEWPLLCKWKSILGDKINGVKSSMGKGCHKHKGNHMEQETAHGKPTHRFGPGQHHPHHHSHHHSHHHHKVHMFLRRAFFTILLPILIGIFAGTLTYLIGMALGCLIAIVVAKLRRNSSYEAVALEDGDEDVPSPGVKAAYAELPEYDSPPVYEAAEKEVVDESH